MAKFKLNKKEARLLLAYASYTAGNSVAYRLVGKLERAGVTTYPTITLKKSKIMGDSIYVNEDEEYSL